jgi:hypothetical protein
VTYEKWAMEAIHAEEQTVELCEYIEKHYPVDAVYEPEQQQETMRETELRRVDE